MIGFTLADDAENLRQESTQNRRGNHILLSTATVSPNALPSGEHIALLDKVSL
jgi:hypothetical protein